MAGTWNALTNLPTNTVETTFLLTDGTVLAQGVSTSSWYRLTPDANGSYLNGTWTTVASSNNAPLYYASGILRDGRLIVAGGEYNNGLLVWLNAAEIYNPVADSWTALPTPAGWTNIGDAPGCVLPDGRFFLGEVANPATRRTAIYDPTTNTWTATANKISNVKEESWSLLPDGSVHAVDCSNPPNAEKYIIAADQWVNAGTTPQVLVDSIAEIGASVLLPDGRLYVIGATGFTALYTFPPISNQVGTWAAGPNIPAVNPGQALGTVDAPAALLPNGKVLFSAGPITTPATFQAPTFFFEFDPATNTTSVVPLPTNSGSKPYWGRMLMLPTGQVLYTDGTKQVDVYAPDGSFDPVWRPTITTCPGNLQPGNTYTLAGRQINGLSQCVYYGNDATQATNYPIVRLESKSSSSVVYCRTFDFSTMGLQTGTVIHTCSFTVPSGTATGAYRLVVVANGIPSEPCDTTVSYKLFKELKFEIKEKLEIKEKFEIKEKNEKLEKVEIKELKYEITEKLGHKEYYEVDQKPEPDIDVKRRDEIDQFGRVQEDLLKTVRTWAAQVDAVHEELERTFIRPDERPEVGPRKVKMEEIHPKKITAAEARVGARKRAFNDGRKELPVSKSAAAFRDAVHSLSHADKGKGGTKGRRVKRVTKRTKTKSTSKRGNAK